MNWINNPIQIYLVTNRDLRFGSSLYYKSVYLVRLDPANMLILREKMRIYIFIKLI